MNKAVSTKTRKIVQTYRHTMICGATAKSQAGVDPILVSVKATTCPYLRGTHFVTQIDSKQVAV